MKLQGIVRIALLAVPLMFGSCGIFKKSNKDPKPVIEKRQTTDFVNQVRENQQTSKFITSKVKFSVEVGQQKLTLTGNLKMRRNDVIRLQLMAFGFVEAGRLEFTKDYVLIMDRINKQFLKAPYRQVDFLRNSGLNFSALQALFWNELFKPNQGSEAVVLDKSATNSFATIESGDDMIISLEDGKMDYSWLASKNTAIIRMANILYKDRFNGNTQLNWDYSDFEVFGRKMFPKKNVIKLTTPDKEVKLSMSLNYIGSDTEWEPRTEVSNKYREVTVDEILRRFMAL
jgi:hypothetical protein